MVPQCIWTSYPLGSTKGAPNVSLSPITNYHSWEGTAAERSPPAPSVSTTPPTPSSAPAGTGDSALSASSSWRRAEGSAPCAGPRWRPMIRWNRTSKLYEEKHRRFNDREQSFEGLHWLSITCCVCSAAASTSLFFAFSLKGEHKQEVILTKCSSSVSN